MKTRIEKLEKLAADVVNVLDVKAGKGCRDSSISGWDNFKNGNGQNIGNDK